jgi:PAS domain S-box-containing protein
MPELALPPDREDAAPAATLQDVKAQIEAAILRNLMLTMSLASLGGILIFGALSLMPDQTPMQRRIRLVSGAVLVLVSLVAWLISRRKGPRVAAAFFAMSATLVAFASALSVGSGIASSGATIPAASIVVMGLVLGPRAGVLTMRLAMGGVIVLLAAQWLSWIPGINPANTQPAASYGVALLIVFWLIGSTVTHYSRLFWNAMRAIDQARKALQAKVEMQDKTQNELIESKQRLTALLDHAPMAVLIFDKDTGRLHYANRHALQAHGAPTTPPTTPTLAQQCLFSSEPYGAAQLLQAIHDTRDHGERQLPWRTRTMAGETIWWDIKLDMLEIDDAQHVVAFGHDITTRLQAEQALIDHRAHLEEQVRTRTAEALMQQHRLEAVIEALPVSLTIKDRQGRYQLSNRLFEEAAGLSKSALLGRRPHELFPPALARILVEHEPELLEGQATVRYESSRTRHDGTRKDHLVTKVPLRGADGEPDGILTLAVDISDQKNLQRELAFAKNEAEHLASVKSDFLANMSHEIRTPLHGMLGMAQIGQRLSGIAPDAQQAFARISHSGKHLLGVINDILDFSKMDAGKLAVDHAPLNPRQVAEDAVAMVAERAQDKGLALHLQCDPTPVAVMGDALRTRQILINLLSNAVKFTERGQVTLSLSVQGERLHFAIQDTGIGMHPEAQARVFSPFEQADGSTSRRFGGTGLGLSISQQLAHLMGGEIHLRSALGEGSTFTLDLPLQEADAAQWQAEQARHTLAEARTRSGPRLAGLRILAADDVAINRDILVGLLSQHDAEVVCCDDGRQALTQLRAHGRGYFDIVLMDVQMPVMNGLQATQLLQMIEPDLPVVALTAHAMPAECERCREAGMIGHLAKPFDTDEMLALILRHTRRQPQVVASSAAFAVDRPGAAGKSLAPSALATAVGATATATTAAAPAQAGPSRPSSRSPTVSEQLNASAIDLQGALTRCGGQEALLRKLITRFCHEQADVATRFQALLQSDPQQARRVAHMLKGTAGNLGMAALSRHAGDLEDALTSADPGLVDASLQTLGMSMQQHQEALQAWLGDEIAA